MLVKAGESYRFLHQDFRGFFAAVHLLNEIKMGMADGRRIPEGMKEQGLSVYVRRMMGEIESSEWIFHCINLPTFFILFFLFLDG